MGRQFIIFGVGCAFAALSLALNSCSLGIEHGCSVRIEDNKFETGFSVRLSKSDCRIEEEHYRRTIQRWINERRPNAPQLEGFYLGRIVNYPWISQYLASEAIRNSEWDLMTGTSHGTHPHDLVKSILIQEEFQYRLGIPFANTPYDIGDVEIEKVLIQDAGIVLKDSKKSGKVPYDAQLWISLVER